MVVVANEPFGETETEPMLGAGSSDDLNCNSRRNSCAEEAYKSISSSMKADPLLIRSPKTALELLSTGARLQNMPLVKQCIENLDHQLEKDNLLMIYSSLSKCKMPGGSKKDFLPSAPPMIVDNDNQRDTDWVQELTDSLRHNCLLEIDKHADYLLKQKDILDLSYLDLLNIVERDTFQVSDEMLVYSAIYRWSITECHRRTLNTNLLNIRAILRELCYTPRYGLIPKTKFMSRTVDGVRGPTRSGILDEKEWRLIRFHVEEKSKKRPVERLPHKWSEPRSLISEKPKILSSRSSSALAANGAFTGSGNNCRNKTTCEKCLINFLTCWTAIFD